MDYGNTINRAVKLVWEKKYLIVLGILAALGSGAGGGGGGGGGGGDNGQSGAFAPMSGEMTALVIAMIVAVVCVALLIGLAFFVISAVARGGLIAGVNDEESGIKSSFGQAWRAGWQKAGRLIGIGILPGIPGILLLLVVLFGLVAYGGMAALVGEGFPSRFLGPELGITLAVVACVLLPVVLVLSILRTFAERACMLEDLGVIASYRRGWEVLSANLGEALLLFLLQLGIGLLLGIVLFLPGILIALCCFLWPLLFIAQGYVTAAVSALWTLAWRQWTGQELKFVEKAPVGL